MGEIALGKDDPNVKGSRQIRERLQILALSRARVVEQLSAAIEPHYRVMLERTVAVLDAEAEALSNQAAAPDTGTDGRAVEAPAHVTRSN